MRSENSSFGILAVLVIIGVLLVSTFTFAAGPQKININSADKTQLMSLAGIGEKVAVNIIAYREKNGPFKTSTDIMKVKGVGPKTLANNKERIFIGPAVMPMKGK